VIFCSGHPSGYTPEDLRLGEGSCNVMGAVSNKKEKLTGAIAWKQTSGSMA